LTEARKKEAAQSAAALNQRGQNLMKEENYSAAADTFVNASQLVNSENTLYLENAGLAFYKAGNYKNFISWLGAAINLDSKAAMTYLHRGEAFAALRIGAAVDLDGRLFGTSGDGGVPRPLLMITEVSNPVFNATASTGKPGYHVILRGSKHFFSSDWGFLPFLSNGMKADRVGDIDPLRASSITKTTLKRSSIDTLRA
jgi:hypothetical protein